MNSRTVSINRDSISTSDIISWIFGIGVFQIGLVNTFWGQPVSFGVFLILLSFAYFPPVSKLVKETIGLAIPGWSKVLLGLFIFWASIGVGELFNKIEVMVNSLQ